MPFARPSAADLQTQAQADLAGMLPGTDPLLPKANLRIIARLLAEGFTGEYGYLDYISKQSVPFTAKDEAFEGWAALKNVTRKPAKAAAGSGAWAGTPGLVLPIGTSIVRGDGQAYLTTAEATVSGGGAVSAPLLAVTPGTAGTLVTGSTLTISQAIPGISSNGVATAGTPGVDVEEFEPFRTRALAIYAAPPQGGSAPDYVEWALQVPGVTRAWVVRNGKGSGTVVVYTMFDLAEAAFNGFPQGVGGCAAEEDRDTPATLDLLTVAEYLWPLQPVTALVYALPPQANTVTFTINLPGATADQKAQIGAAIAQTFLTFGAPGGEIAHSDIEAAISVIPGTQGFVITAEACTHGSVAPTNGNITSNAGYLPRLGVITWS